MWLTSIVHILSPETDNCWSACTFRQSDQSLLGMLWFQGSWFLQADSKDYSDWEDEVWFESSLHTSLKVTVSHIADSTILLKHLVHRGYNTVEKIKHYKTEYNPLSTEYQWQIQECFSRLENLSSASKTDFHHLMCLVLQRAKQDFGPNLRA